MQYFYLRLREAREALGKTQDEMAEFSGLSKRSYCAYEAGETQPSAKLLAALAAAGVDIAYILTGARSAPIESTLTRREQALLVNYRASTEDGKRYTEQSALLQSQQSQQLQQPQAAKKRVR